MTARSVRSFGIYAELDGAPESARQARTLVRHALGDAHPSADDAALIMSELVGNAIAHSRSGLPGGTVVIAVESTASDAVVLHVRDAGGASLPREQVAATSAENGRGLAIVSSLAAKWGSRATRTGRVTWCRLTADRNLASRDVDALARRGLNHAADKTTPQGAATRAGPDCPDREIPEREAG